MLAYLKLFVLFFFSSRRRHTRYWRDWSSDVCSSDLHGKVPQLAAADHLDRDLPADPIAREQDQQVLCVLDRLAVEGGDDVAYDEAAAAGGAAVLDPDHQETSPLGEPEPLPVRELDRLAQDAEVAALDGAPLLD